MLVVAACSDPSPFASSVFIGADFEIVECGSGGDAPCVRVFSEVDGSGPGRGACILYATTRSGQVAVGASELELVPGKLVEWIVKVPGHLGSLGWNPVCVPTAEG